MINVTSVILCDVSGTRLWPLEIIEVQSGSYVGEDDIVRFEDTYERAEP